MHRTAPATHGWHAGAVIATAVTCAVLGVADDARGATTVSVSADGTTLQLTGDATGSAFRVEAADFDPTRVEVVSDFFSGQNFDHNLVAGPGCQQTNDGAPDRVRCSALTTDLAERAVSASLDGGDDEFLTLVPFDGATTLEGGTGDDILSSFDEHEDDGVDASTHDDVIDGGAGNDRLASYGGDDTLDGGVGADDLSGGNGVDTLRGGDGGDSSLAGGAGDDHVFGGADADNLSGGAGEDELRGEGGDDGLVGDAGDDTLDGADGDDRFEAAAGAATPTDGKDVIIGGPGTDAMSYSSQTYADMSATLDNQANDGRPGEDDDIRTDVEDVTSSHGAAATLVGTAADNRLVGLSDRNTITGGDGGDDLTGSFGPDAVDGGPGDDEIRTGDDADDIVGGPGRDEIFADICSLGSCNEPDRIDVADGEADKVYCGGGGDTVRADRIDELLLCDTVTYVDGEPPPPPPARPTPDQQAPPPTTPITVPPTPDTTGPAFAIPAKAKALTASRRGIVVFPLGRVAEDVTGVLSLKTRGKVRISARRAVLALGTKEFQGLRNQEVNVRVRLGAKGRRTLRRLKRLKVRATITLRDTAGNATIRVLDLRLKAPRAKRRR